MRGKDEGKASPPRPSPPAAEERAKTRTARRRPLPFWDLGRSSHFARWKLLGLRVRVLKNFRFRPILGRWQRSRNRKFLCRRCSGKGARVSWVERDLPPHPALSLRERVSLRPGGGRFGNG